MSEHLSETLKEVRPALMARPVFAMMDMMMTQPGSLRACAGSGRLLLSAGR